MEKPEIITAKAVCELISKKNPVKHHKLTKDQRINFAYDYWTLSSEDITELYVNLAENYSKEAINLAKIIGEFIDTQKITSIKRFNNSFIDKDLKSIENAATAIRTNGNWLSKYDLEREFTKQSKSQHPVRYGYIKQDGSTLLIDKNRAQNILGILMEADIPTAKCIVTASFPYYAHDDMDTYIKSFQKRK